MPGHTSVQKRVMRIMKKKKNDLARGKFIDPLAHVHRLLHALIILLIHRIPKIFGDREPFTKV